LAVGVGACRISRRGGDGCLWPSCHQQRPPGGSTFYARSAATTERDFDLVVTAAADGEHEALATLFRAYQPLLLRYLRAKEPGVADDLAGEVWVAVARHLRRFVGDEPAFRRWLFTIARCQVVDQQRRSARRRTDPLPPGVIEGTEGLASWGPGARHGSDNPATVVVDALSAQEAIAVVVAGLTPDQAEAVLLRVVTGLPVAAVAQVMGRTEAAVRVLCHRALRRLADRFPAGVLVE
jgi:RNA polymerase sigma-70 factor (ECF subfamily)